MSLVIQRLRACIAGLVEEELLLEQFEGCVSILEAHGAQTLAFYELFHEFGHYVWAWRNGGTVSFVKAAEYLFRFDELGGIDMELVPDNDMSVVLCSFDLEGVPLLNALVETTYGGMQFSRRALLCSGWSLRSWVFNFRNSGIRLWGRVGSDFYNWKRVFVNVENAEDFNNASRALVDVYSRTGSFKEVLRHEALDT